MTVPLKKKVLRIAGADLPSDGRTLLMGIVNATPDSFSDGRGECSTEEAVRRGEACLSEGAHILDVGGESTRPGAVPVSWEEECSRVVPVIRALRGRYPRLALSIDTRKPQVARAAFEAGANLLNDVSGLEAGGAEMAEVLREFHRGAVVAFSIPVPAEEDFRFRAGEFFRRRLRWLTRTTGLAEDFFVVDPGIGFQKTDKQNWECISAIPYWRQFLPCPVLIGHSKKSFLGRTTGRGVAERTAATTAVSVIASLYGADILRVHDIASTRDAVAVADALQPLPEAML